MIPNRFTNLAPKVSFPLLLGSTEDFFLLLLNWILCFNDYIFYFFCLLSCFFSPKPNEALIRRERFYCRWWPDEGWGDKARYKYKIIKTGSKTTSERNHFWLDLGAVIRVARASYPSVKEFPVVEAGRDWKSCSTRRPRSLLWATCERFQEKLFNSKSWGFKEARNKKKSLSRNKKMNKKSSLKKAENQEENKTKKNERKNKTNKIKKSKKSSSANENLVSSRNLFSDFFSSVPFSPSSSHSRCSSLGFIAFLPVPHVSPSSSFSLCFLFSRVLRAQKFVFFFDFFGETWNELFFVA